jgi:beta-lactamase regulating signal transducer with metallopeptidase domain
MTKFDKEFFINDFQEKYDSCKRQFMSIVEKHHEMSQDKLLNELCITAEMICYFSDLLEILKE